MIIRVSLKLEKTSFYLIEDFKFKNVTESDI